MEDKMALDDILGQATKNVSVGNKYGASVAYEDNTPVRGGYALFSEQYMERPVISGDSAVALTPTACTIKLIPVIDDF